MTHLGQQFMTLYLESLQKRPLVTNAGTGLVTAAIGDIACQTFIEPPNTPYRLRRTIEMSLIRAGFMGPFMTYYFPFLARLAPGTSPIQVGKRLVLDQMIGGPITISGTYILAACLQGKPETAWPRIQNQLIPSLGASLCFWPFVHAFNFSYVPVIHQPLVAHLSSIAWQAYLSYQSNVSLDEKDTKVKEKLLNDK